MTRYGHNVEFQQQGPFPQGGYQQNDRQQYGQQQYGQQQGGYQQGGYQQGGQPQEGYQQGQGEAQSYYSESQQNQQHQYPPSGSGQYQQGPPHGSGPRDQFNDGDGQDGERGFMGAVAGGAAGAFGGHKIGGATGHSKSSTIIGALAGAFGGHKLQDAAEDWKDDRDDKKEEEKRKEEEEKRREEEKKRREEDEKKRRDDDRYSSHHRRRSSSSRRRSRSSSRGSNRRRGGHYAGNFTASSRDIRLDAHGDYVLHASCKRENGDYQHTSISLNKLLENDRGSFRWSAGGHHGGSSQVTVQNGDTLRGIAARFNTSFEEIARQNNISNPDLIYPGQTLQVPGGGSQGGGGFGNSARHVRLVDGGQRLEGELSRDGDWVLSSIVLDERIKNFNGTLELV